MNFVSRALARAIGLLQQTSTGAHLHCAKCRYDLFGLPGDARCPECGSAVLATAMHTAMMVTEDVVGDPTEHPARRPFKFVKETLGYPIDAFLFVRDVLRLTNEKNRDSQPRVPVTAHDVCRTFRDFTILHFENESEARAVLLDWNIRRSDDVGRIVWTMVRCGLLRAEVGDALEQFNGLFDVEAWAKG